MDLPGFETILKVKQIKAYLYAMQNPKYLLQDTVWKEKGCGLERGKS